MKQRLGIASAVMENPALILLDEPTNALDESGVVMVRDLLEKQKKNRQMLMYGKEASNRKQEIDRQHYTIPNQRPKDKHCGKI